MTTDQDLDIQGGSTIVSIDQFKSISVVTSDPSDPGPRPAPAPWRP